MGNQEKQRIHVTLLLSGGHSRSIDLKPSDPLLRSLLQTIANRVCGGRDACAFNIALPGTKSMIFASTELVGIITDPPIVIDTGTPELAAPSAPATSKWRLIENFLSPAENRELLAFAESQQASFGASTVLGGSRRGYRKSKVLYDVDKYADLFRDKLRAELPRTAADLNLPWFEMSHIDCQITAHNDGDYFAPHSDLGHETVKTRVITYVYYFYNEPKAFEGGEIRIFDEGMSDSSRQRAVNIAPSNNSILFFPSSCFHEVLKVRCSSRRFRDSRFTFHGWIHAAESRGPRRARKTIARGAGPRL